METARIERTRNNLAGNMQKCVQIILNEYGDYIPEQRKSVLVEIEDYRARVAVRNSGTISMFATDSEIIMPKGAYEIFRYMQRIPGYGINKKHKVNRAGEILNARTYYDYIKHVFISGMSVEEFFEDALLHETMHFCGSHGGSAMREGFTELKTRELAQKYSLQTSRCGYPKEVEIASRFQQIVGVDVANKITFAQNNREIYRIIEEECGKSIADLFFEIYQLMDEELKAKYDHSRFGGILGPIKKAKAYAKIDYSRVYEKLERLEREIIVHKKNTFADGIREQTIEVLPRDEEQLRTQNQSENIRE